MRSSGPEAGRRRLLGAAVALIVVIAAALVTAVVMGDGDEPTAAPGDSTSTCTGPAATLPLLGTPGEVPPRAALAVKIENTGRGRPQAGLNEADVVFEEQVEGRLTRLLAVYQSQDPETVGPVRSARTTDLTLLAELGRPLFAWSGANRTVRELVEAADVVDVGAAAAADAYRRDPDRRAPYDLFASPADLRAAGGTEDAAACAAVPPALFAYRDPGTTLAGPGVVDATGYGITGLATSVRWDWDAASGWVRTQDGTPHVDADGTRVAVPNVIIRSTPYHDSGQRDSTGAVVPEAETIGEGDAWLLSDGRVQEGRWQKASADAPTTYTASDGSPMLLTPGRTWVEVVPPGSGELATP
jgi:hypothetical protein